MAQSKKRRKSSARTTDKTGRKVNTKSAKRIRYMAKQYVKSSKNSAVIKDHMNNMNVALKESATVLNIAGTLTDEQMAIAPNITNTIKTLAKDILDFNESAKSLRERTSVLLKSPDVDSKLTPVTDELIALGEDYIVWFIDYEGAVLPSVKELSTAITRIHQKEGKATATQ